MQLSEKLSILRKRKKLSVKQLSVMTGISPTTLLNYESGKTFPTAENVLKLSVALGVTCQELIPLEEKEKYDSQFIPKLTPVELKSKILRLEMSGGFFSSAHRTLKNVIFKFFARLTADCNIFAVMNTAMHMRFAAFCLFCVHAQSADFVYILRVNHIISRPFIKIHMQLYHIPTLQ